MLRPSSVRCGYFVGAAISAAGLLSALPGTTKAAVLYSDNFDSYTNGNLSGQGGWTATAAAATPMQVAGTVNKFVAIGTSGQDEYHPLSGTAPHLDGNMLETSFTANVTAAQATGDYFTHLSDPAGTSTFFYQRTFAKSTTGGWLLGLLSTSGGTAAPVYGTTVLPLNQDQQVDIKWNFVPGALNDTFVVTVNGSPYLNYTWDPVSSAEPTGISAVNLRQGSAANAANVNFDNLLVQGVLPEPTSLAAVALLGAALMGRRRVR
jgi:hypothetical protein